MNKKDLTGQRFGRLIAIEPIEERKDTHIIWRCLCDCGNECFVKSSRLINGATKSCGCFAREQSSKRATTHGISGTPIYKIWASIIYRCENPNCPAYKNYGGRGIKICERWRKSFEAFYADVGDPPKGKSFDRYPNNDGDYEPTNWRWATASEQVANSRPNSCGPGKQYWFRAWHKDSMAQYLSNNQGKFARRHKLDNSSIAKCLKNKRKTTKGWTFIPLERYA